MTAVFACTRCDAVPEQHAEGGALVAVVRHRAGCPTLVDQSRTRWATALAALTMTRRQRPCPQQPRHIPHRALIAR